MKKELTLYSISQCPYCTKAKSLLQQNGIPYTEILVTNNDDEINHQRGLNHLITLGA